MAIYVRCTKCKCDHKQGVKICRKCERPLGEKKKYKVVVKIPNGKRVVRLVDTITLAKRIENKIKGEIAREIHLEIKKAPYISDIWERYIAWAKKHKKSWYDDETRWNKHVKEKVDTKRMDQLKTHNVEKILDGMVKDKNDPTKKHAPATIKQVLVLVRRVYNWANKQDFYKGPNPASDVETPKLNNEVTECLTREQLENLIKTLDVWDIPLNALITKFALYTGLRMSEILGLEWLYVDLEKCKITLHDPKGNPTKLPINTGALNILKKAQELAPIDDCSYVFPKSDGGKKTQYYKTWTRIRKRAGIPKGFRFHGLRHTYASYLASSGEVDLYTLQRLLNQQTPNMTQRYAHLQDEILKKGANVADKVFVIKNTSKNSIDNESHPN